VVKAFQSLVVDCGGKWFGFGIRYSAMTSIGIHLITFGASGPIPGHKKNGGLTEPMGKISYFKG